MSICLSNLNEYELICNPMNHDLPSEISQASYLAISDTSLLLINIGTDRLLLYDLSLSSSKFDEINWPSDTYGTIRDICWSQYISSFLILGDELVCSYSPETKNLAIQFNSPSVNDQFWSLAVLNYDVYILCRHDTLYRYCLPSWTLCRTWSRTDLIYFNTTDKFIQLIRAHPSMGIIALLIRLRQHRRWRVDLFDRRMQKLHSGESIRMITDYPNVMLYPFEKHGQWILMNEDYIWKINSNGYCIEYYRRTRKNKVEEY